MLYWSSNMLFPSTEHLYMSLFFLRHISLHFQRLNDFLVVSCRHFRIKKFLVTLCCFVLFSLTDICKASHFCTIFECNLFVLSFSFINENNLCQNIQRVLKDHWNQKPFAFLSYAIRHHLFYFTMSLLLRFWRFFSCRSKIHNGEVIINIDLGHLCMFEQQIQEVCHRFRLCP